MDWQNPERRVLQLQLQLQAASWESKRTVPAGDLQLQQGVFQVNAVAVLAVARVGARTRALRPARPAVTVSFLPNSKPNFSPVMRAARR
jgi:hypothetical protein